jgi:glycogen(starch) synthase
MIMSDPQAAAQRIAAATQSRIKAVFRRGRQPKVAPKWTIARARRHFAGEPGMKELVEKVLREVPPCDLVIAHDYYTYVLAEALALRDRASLAIDCHEYAMEQYDYRSHTEERARQQWHYTTRPYVDALQRYFFNTADAVSTVSDGIADLLASDYGLTRPPAVIRSVPFYEPMPFRPCGEQIQLVYHGLVSPTRNLDVAVRSLALCRPEFRLTIRGPVTPGYDVELLRLAGQVGCADRLKLAPPVPFADLVRSANEADVGYFVFDNFSRQREFTSPNKFFEYMMAGLALVVSDVRELSRFISERETGVLVGEFSPDSVAATINALDRTAIDRMKKKSLEAARDLCWEQEQRKLVDAYGL